MSLSSLGPLERSILRALAAAEALGAGPLPTEAVWRLLPGYVTHAANVEAALRDGPLAEWVRFDGGWALPGAAPGPGGAAASWSELGEPLRGMAKLPWVEGLAVAGAVALGAAARAVDLVVLAEGGRSSEAEWAARAWLRRVGLPAVVVATVDADELPREPAGTAEALWWATLRPVRNPEGWTVWREHNPWLDEAFPNDPAQGWAGLPEFEACPRIDGLLAAVRRRWTRSRGPLLRSIDRRPGRRVVIEDFVVAAVGAPAVPSGPAPELQARYEARWAEVQAFAPSAARASAVGEPSDRDDSAPPAVSGSVEARQAGSGGSGEPVATPDSSEPVGILDLAASDEPAWVRIRRPRRTRGRDRGPQRRPRRAPTAASAPPRRRRQ